MDRQEIQNRILAIMADKFEIAEPDLNDDLREKYNFDSIDAIDLLAALEQMLSSTLSDEEKRRAMDIRTINHVIEYVEELVRARA